MPAKKTVKNNRSSSTPPFGKSYTFFEDVHAVVRLVPIGRVTTYGAIAAYLGTRLSARMVGWAMNASHRIIPYVPAHRVVNRNGMLSGKNHFSTSTEMEELLRGEGIVVKKNQVVDFNQKFWDPGLEIGIED
jgi:methylated-DNA-protein-cysteine methyltransferase-like protein